MNTGGARAFDGKESIECTGAGGEAEAARVFEAETCAAETAEDCACARNEAATGTDTDDVRRKLDASTQREDKPDVRGPLA